MADYDFRTLSPSDFELLIRDLLAAEYRWRLEAFGHGRDGGVDLRASTQSGKVVVQCKHYLGSTFSDLRSSARREVPKMNKEKPDRYLFVTSQDLNRTQKDTLASDITPWLSNTADLLTRIDINELLAKHPTVELQHFKLWLASTTVLERIVHSGIWERSEALLEDIRDRVKLYVRTSSFEKASQVLKERHLVVLTGPPGVGKSMLAEMLALAHWYEDWQIVPIEADVDEAWEAYKPQRKQVFLYDDFLGQTDVSERRARKDSWLVRFMDRVARTPNKRLVMTTRSQILKQTALISEPIARTDFRVLECVVQIADYGPVQRARMLYNHLYFSTLTRDVVRDYSSGSFYWNVVQHKNFSPRIVELVIKRFYSSADELKDALNHTLEHPLDLWGIIFNTSLSDLAQRVVLALASFPVGGVRSEKLKELVRKEARAAEYSNALRVLEGTFIQIRQSPSGGAIVSYANPSVRDFVLAFLNEESDYFLNLISSSKHLGQVKVLLEYASSGVGGEFKYPNCARAVLGNQDNVTQVVFGLIDENGRDGVPEKEQARRNYQEVVRPLLGMMQPAYHLVRSSFDPMVAVLLERLRGEASGYMDPDDWQLFNVAIMARHLENPSKSPYSEELRWAFDNWGSLLYSIDDVGEFEDFFNKHQSTLEGGFDAYSAFRDYVVAGLRQELENLSGNERDRDTDYQWVDAVEDAARRLYVWPELAATVESSRTSIEEYYAEREQFGSQPTSGAGYWPSSGETRVSAKDRIVIEGMFRELS
ncbi:nSTAND3 domain-containing NTPase [Micromonospora sp. SD19]